jgi:hypothetical protein
MAKTGMSAIRRKVSKLGTVKMLEAISGQLRIKKFTGSELKQMRIERMEEKIKTPQTQSYSFYHFSASRR